MDGYWNQFGNCPFDCNTAADVPEILSKQWSVCRTHGKFFVGHDTNLLAILSGMDKWIVRILSSVRVLPVPTIQSSRVNQFSPMGSGLDHVDFVDAGSNRRVCDRYFFFVPPLSFFAGAAVFCLAMISAEILSYVA